MSTRFVILISIILKYGLALDQKFQFLNDFFKNRKEMLTIYTCASQESIKMFLKDGGDFGNLIGFKVYKKSSNQLDKVFNNFSHRNWYVIDVDSCGEFSELLSYMNRTNLFRYRLKHLILIDKQKYEEFKEALCQYNIFVSSEIYIATINGLKIDIFEVYKIGKTSDCITANFGNWSSEEESNNLFLNNNPLTQKRQNFHQHEIVICTVVSLNKSLSADFDFVSQTTVDEPYFFEDFPNVHNMLRFFNASIRFRAYRVYGHLNHTTGKFYGMLNDLSLGLGDISGTGIFISEDRQKAVDFILGSNPWGTKFLLKQPSMSYVENIYFMTFTGRVWFAAFLVLIIFGIGTYILLNKDICKKKNIRKANNTKYTVSDVALLTLEALCQQGTNLESRLYSGRIMLFFLFTACMFLYAAYSGYILVLLQSTKPIASIRHLVDSRLDCGGINISFVMDWYHVNKDPALRALYEKKLHANRFMSLENGLARVREGNFAFQATVSLAYIHILKTFTNSDICKLQELPGYLNSGQYYATPKTSQYKDFFKVGLMRVAEAGLVIRNKQRLSSKPKCYNEAGHFQSVGIYDCYIIFKLFLIGWAVSLLILLIEIAISKINHSHHLKSRRWN